MFSAKPVSLTLSSPGRTVEVKRELHCPLKTGRETTETGQKCLASNLFQCVFWNILSGPVTWFNLFNGGTFRLRVCIFNCLNFPDLWKHPGEWVVPLLSCQGNGSRSFSMSPLACVCQSTAFKDILSDSVRSSPALSVSNECYCSFKVFKYVVLFFEYSRPVYKQNSLTIT